MFIVSFSDPVVSLSFATLRRHFSKLYEFVSLKILHFLSPVERLSQTTLTLHKFSFSLIAEHFLSLHFLKLQQVLASTIA